MGFYAQQISFAQADTNFVSLFNGTDLTGWSIKNAGTTIKDFAKVKDGYLDLESAGGNGWLWLFSDKEYTDFVFKCKFSTPTGEQGNSGINFRSAWDPNDQGGYLNGPQVDIYSNSNWRTGLILDMTKGNERWFFPDLPNWNITKQNTPAGWTFKYFPDWNDLEISVVGMTVITKVNGITYANWNGEGKLNDQLHKTKNVGSKGYLALQAHSDQKVVIYFKDIKVADLTNPTTVRKSHTRYLSQGRPGFADGLGAAQVFSLDGKRVTLPQESHRAMKAGLYVVKSGDSPTLRALVR